MTETPPLLAWEIRFPLLTNPHIVRAWLRAMGLVYLLSLLILAPLMIATGEMDGLPGLALAFLLVVGGLTLLGFLIMLLVFGNRSRARFVLSAQGVAWESLDDRARALSRMAVLAGGFLGSPTAAGAGLIAISRERIHIPWSAINDARYDEKHLTIRLRNLYRDVLHLYCSPDTWAAARALVEARVGVRHMAGVDSDRLRPVEAGAEHRNSPRLDAAGPAPIAVTVDPGDAPHRAEAGFRSTLAGALFSTLLVIASCMPLYALGEITGLHLMVPLLIMLFALAMIWLIPLFAWVVLALGAWIPLQVIMALSGSVEIRLVSTYTFSKVELLDAGEWIVIALSVAGLGYLGRLSIHSLQGRHIPWTFR